MIKKYKPGILWENDDELYLIGTKDELQKLAKSIIDFTNNPVNYYKLIDKNVFGTQQQLTEPLCTFSIANTLMVESEKDKEDIINYFKTKVEGDSLPIDWIGRKKLDAKNLKQS